MRLSLQSALAGVSILLALLAFGVGAWPLLALHGETVADFAERRTLDRLADTAQRLDRQAEIGRHVVDNIADFVDDRGDGTAEDEHLRWVLQTLVSGYASVHSAEYVDYLGQWRRIERNNEHVPRGFTATYVARRSGIEWVHATHLDSEADPVFGELMPRRVDQRLTRWYQDATLYRRTRLAFVESDLQPGMRDRPPMLEVTRPVIDRDGNVNGVVRARLVDPQLAETLGCQRLHPCPASALIQDRDSVVWATALPPHAPNHTTAYARAAAWNRAALDALDGRLASLGSQPRVIGPVTVDGAPQLAFGFRRSAQAFDWTVLHMVPTGQSAPRLGAPMLEIGAIALLLVLAIAGLAGKAIGKAITQKLAQIHQPLTTDPLTPRWQAAAAGGGLVLKDLEAVAADVGACADELWAISTSHTLLLRGLRDGLLEWQRAQGSLWASHNARTILDRANLRRIDDLFSAVVPDDRARLQTTFDAVLADPQTPQDAEIRISRLDGSETWLHVRVAADDSPKRCPDGTPHRLVILLADITPVKTAEARLLREVFHDRLTGLPNRVLLIERLTWALERVKVDADARSALITIDLDRFRTVNDNLGQAAGDDLLVTVARRLSVTAGTRSLVARIGSDQFAVLSEETTDNESARLLAERLNRALEAPMMLAGQELFPTAALGVALCTGGYSRAEAIISDANLAMARSKDLGRGLIQVYEPRMRGAFVAGQLSLETDLRHALDRREFELFYQPIIELSGGRIAGFEALLRWRSADRGLVPPAEFIPLCEDLGLIVAIGDWAMHEASRQIARWSGPEGRHETLFISVNVSRRQLDEPTFADRVQAALDSSGIAPARLHLEVTESLLMEQRQSVLNLIGRLKAMGVRLSIDDFGTGYSSLGRLHRFPFDILKIDRIFVADILTNQDSGVIVRSVVDLAQALGLEVIAEGAETPADVDALREAGCEYCQGYVYARPMPAAEAERFLALHGWQTAQPRPQSGQKGRPDVARVRDGKPTS